MASPSYITVPEFYDAFDRRLIEELGTDIGGAGSMTSANEKIVTAIERASEDVQMAATVGKRYTTDNLDDLVTDDRWALKGLVADLAIYHLVARRMSDIPEAIKEKKDRAEEILKSLRDGDAVFPIAANREAGKPKISIITEQQRARLGMVSDTEFFPARLGREV